MTVDISKEEAIPVLQKFVHEFFIDRCKELVLLENSIKQSNFKEIKLIAHNWKGFSSPYGFIMLETLSRELEVHADNKKIIKIEETFMKIKEYLRLKEKYI